MQSIRASPALNFIRPTHRSLLNLNKNRSFAVSTRKMAGEDSKDKSITGWASGDGSFKRQTSSFRDVIEKGGKFEPEKGELASSCCLHADRADTLGRYHLYVCLACPWAHRALIVRELKGLQDYIGE